MAPAAPERTRVPFAAVTWIASAAVPSSFTTEIFALAPVVALRSIALALFAEPVRAIV